MVRRRSNRADPWQGSVKNSFDLFRGFQQWQEMATASAMTIGLRLNQIQVDINSNRAPDMVEFSRMWTEKQAAWAQASGAVFRWQQALVQLQWQEGLRLWRGTTGRLGILGASQNWALPAQWLSLTLRGISQTTKPYHTKSTANARRLSRLRRTTAG